MRVEVEYDPIRNMWYVQERSSWRNLWWPGRHIALGRTREDALRLARIRVRDGYLRRKEVVDLESEEPPESGSRNP